MPAVCDGLRWMTRVGLPSIQQHLASPPSELLRRFQSLGGCVRLYGPTDARDRGGVVAFNLFSGGRALNYETVEAAARRRGIAIRGGRFCNPGAAEYAFGWSAANARACLEGEFSVARFRDWVGDYPVGALRASPGIATTEADLERLVELVTELTASSRARASLNPI